MQPRRRLSPRGRRPVAPSSRRRRATVFLDRDGVIVRNVMRSGRSHAPRQISEFRLLPGANSAIAKLHKAGFVIIIVTNQPDIGNGLVDPQTVAAMHSRLRRLLRIDDIETCPHRQSDGCHCRKPRPGMLLAAARRYGIDTTRSFMVGDRGSDIAAGHSVGCYTILIKQGNEMPRGDGPDRVARSLREAARHILRLSD